MNTTTTGTAGSNGGAGTDRIIVPVLLPPPTNGGAGGAGGAAGGLTQTVALPAVGQTHTFTATGGQGGTGGRGGTDYRLLFNESGADGGNGGVGGVGDQTVRNVTYAGDPGMAALDVRLVATGGRGGTGGAGGGGYNGGDGGNGGRGGLGSATLDAFTATLTADGASDTLSLSATATGGAGGAAGAAGVGGGLIAPANGTAGVAGGQGDASARIINTRLTGTADAEVFNLNATANGVSATAAMAGNTIATQGGADMVHVTLSGSGGLALSMTGNIFDLGEGDDGLTVSLSTANFAVTGNTFRGGAGADTVTIAGQGGTLDLGANAVEGVELLRLTGFNRVTGVTGVAEGGSSDDRLEGTAGNETISGRAGYDVLLGLGGDDVLAGGADRDTISGGTGVDTVVYNANFADVSIAFRGLDVIISGPDGRDQVLADVELFRFNDITIDRNTADGVDDLYYWTVYRDVLAAGMDPDDHFALAGRFEGRDPNALFSMTTYVSQNPGVALADAYSHYLTVGWTQDRDPVGFDSDAYLARYPDVAAAGINPFLHYLGGGAAEGRQRSAALDEVYYLASNPDVDGVGIDPFVHYYTAGRFEGRQPLPPAASSGADMLTAFDDYGVWA